MKAIKIFFIFSIIISGVLLSTKGTIEASEKIFNRIADKRGSEFLSLTANTIRSVVKGVLGVAVIQAFLAGAGFFLASVPHAGIWCLIALVLAVIQVGTSLVIVPVIIYLFTTGNPLFAGLWSVYFVIVIFSDNDSWTKTSDTCSHSFPCNTSLFRQKSRVLSAISMLINDWAFPNGPCNNNLVYFGYRVQIHNGRYGGNFTYISP